MKVFYKGEFCDSDSVCIDSGLPHFRYGMGFFETLLYDGEAVQHLDMHLNRLFASCGQFGLKPITDPYSDIINRLLAENGLSGQMARVNICQMAVSMTESVSFVSALPYTPPEEKVFKLCLYPHIHDSYLSCHKSMNYMHFMLAKKFAADNRCDDVILTDVAGTVLETSTTALLMEKEGSYYVSGKGKRLDSIALQLFCEKNTVIEKDINIKDIHSYKLFVLNSLMGKRPAEFIS